jgi:hypothetical protein
MEFLRIFKSIIFHDGRALCPHSLKNNGLLVCLKFLDDRFAIDRVDIENGKRLRRADPYLDHPWMVHVLQLKDRNLLKKKNPSSHDQ